MDFDERRRKLVALLAIRRRMLKNERRWWVRPSWAKRQDQEDYHNLINEMRLFDPDLYFNYFRMTPERFDELLQLVEPLIKKNTNFRNPIGASERLALTLRYLVSGDSMMSLSYSFRIRKSTASGIIKEVCKDIWIALKPKVLSAPNSEKWLQIAKEFQMSWQFPNCIGALDGKHIMIQAPDNSGSEYFNYKGHFSIVLLAVCDANCKFTVVDIGASGRQSDGGIFSSSTFGKALAADKLKIPCPSCLPNSDIVAPFVFVADEAFPLKTNLMRLFPGSNLTMEKRIFNYRLSQSRRCIENAFGIMSSRFRIFRKPIVANVDVAVDITKTSVCLHNFLKGREGSLPNMQKIYCPLGFGDTEDSSGKLQPGLWQDDEAKALSRLNRTGSNMHGLQPKCIRNVYMEYFNKDGAVVWQMSHVTASS